MGSELAAAAAPVAFGGASPEIKLPAGKGLERYRGYVELHTFAVSFLISSSSQGIGRRRPGRTVRVAR